MSAPPDTAPAAAERLSTAPVEAPPARSGPYRAGPLRGLVRAWRQLTSMRTALLLLFLLAIAAVPGSLLPQRSLNPIKVEEFFRDHPSLAPLLDRLSAFDVFAAPWFAAIYLLLFVSLVGCLVPRIRLHARALVRRPPKAPARPSRLAHGACWTTGASPAQAVSAGRDVLGRRRFRVAPTGDTLAAEKGYLRETGNLVFHVCLVVLLAGIGLGAGFGYQGSVLVVRGDGFSNGLVSYDQFSHGRLVDTGRLRPFSLTVRQFEATYQDNGQPRSFRADVDYQTDLDTPTHTADIRVNHPLRIGSAKVYLIGHGYAPHFVLRNAKAEVVWDAYQPCLQADAMLTSTCTVKVADAGLPPTGPRRVPQQLAFSGFFFPTLHMDPAEGAVSVHPAARAPALTLQAYVGNLHLDEGIPQNVYALDRRDLRVVPIGGPSGAGRPAQLLRVADRRQRTLTGLPGGLTLSVDGVREYAVFQVRSDPYKGLVLGAAAAIVLGLLASLRVRRRRVWLRATEGADGRTVVEVGGLSRTDADGFAAEFDQIAGEVRARTPEETRA